MSRALWWKNLLRRSFLVPCSGCHCWIFCNCCPSPGVISYQTHWNPAWDTNQGCKLIHIPNIDTGLFYLWVLKGRFVIFHPVCQKQMQSELRQFLRVYALLLGSPKKHCPAKRLAPVGWRNKLPWMENSFLEESPLSCLRPETRHFPSEVKESILDCSHKSSFSPTEAVVGLVTRTLMTLYPSSKTRCLWRLSDRTWSLMLKRSIKQISQFLFGILGTLNISGTVNTPWSWFICLY